MKLKRVDEEEDKKWLTKLLEQIDGYEYSWSISEYVYFNSLF